MAQKKKLTLKERMVKWNKERKKRTKAFEKNRKKRAKTFAKKQSKRDKANVGDILFGGF